MNMKFNTSQMSIRRRITVCAVALPCLNTLLGCSSTSPFANLPMSTAPQETPAYIEKINTGSLFQAGMDATSLFSGDRKPRYVGDTLKIDIAEKFAATSKVNTSTSRENKVSTKGPGTANPNGGFIDRVLNVDASAAGSDAYKGKGTTDNAGTFNALLTASVINVLPNGHLLVAGERSITLNGGTSNLRFHGVVNPKTVKAGNIVASEDVLNARFEVGGQGDVSDAGSRNWLQRFLTNNLVIW
ncbi:flagellar basal body L-ring protein FlgH [Aquabacterium sp. CECT 9606]|uniref:flagellar basal body L-ring protein FlgH n=1 Tax=Aquabacterium sp. CECT 9606 TaxID=2845822 RepID=UPI001E615C52|nr:flagellar basal body L-ring protein FlgH [Aquabacterium sp. CECT 9606]CAH0354263.1 Flagellar L-ring protein [Aquabacterium sp. CECT 9606]